MSKINFRPFDYIAIAELDKFDDANRKLILRDNTRALNMQRAV